ncbi:MAG: diadenylate cyclase [bacterium]
MMDNTYLFVKYFIFFVLLLDLIFNLFFCLKNRLYIFLSFKFILFFLSVLVFNNELLLILLLLVNLGLSMLMGFAFQIEYRYFFTKYKLDNFSTMKFLGIGGIGGVSVSKFIDELVEAVFELGLKKIGALIVIERKVSLDYYISNGYSLISDVSLIVLESIFNENSLLHDGAVIIRDYRIVAAKCFLPIDTSNNIDFLVGARHRAAIGITQNTDAIAIVVSATNGNVSYAIEGKIYYNIDKQQLIEYLQRDLLYNKIDFDKLHRLADKNN